MKRFAAGNAAVVGAYVVIHRYSAPSGPKFATLDKVIIAGTAVVSLYAVFVMVAGTRKWSERALGLYLFLCGMGVGLLGLTWRALISHASYPDARVRDLGRAAFVVGLPLLAYGLTVWSHEHWRVPGDTDMTQPDAPGWDGKSERRSGKERRFGWRKEGV